MLLPIIILLSLIVLNGIFAMSELAMMTSRKSRLQQAAKAGSKGASAAISLAHEPTRFLSTVQIGITLIGILAGAFGENSLSGHIEPIVARAPGLGPYADTISLVLVVIVITYFSLVVGELVPKRIALAHPEAVAMLISRPLNALSIVAAIPVRVLTVSTEGVLRLLPIKPKQGDDVSEEDVKALIARATSTGIFTPQELRLFQRSMRVGGLVVRDLMIPRSDIVWIDENQPVDSVRILLGTNPYSHFPIGRGSVDRLIGVVHVKDLVAHGLTAGNDFRVADIGKKPHFVPATMPALSLLEHFQTNRQHVAFVVDEFGGLLGMLTLNDLTRAIVGDSGQARPEASSSITRRGEREWLVDGRLPLHELVIALELPPEVESELPDASTAAGLVTATLGHIPNEGETFDWHGLRIEVIDMDGLRVDKIMVTRV